MQTNIEGVCVIINRNLVISELMRSREALDIAIAYLKTDTADLSGTSGISAAGYNKDTDIITAAGGISGKVIRAGEGRGIAILTHLRDAGGSLSQRDFEDICIKHCRTLVGAGGFIARGSIRRQIKNDGSAEYIITDKGRDIINKWELRYGKDWMTALEYSAALENPGISDNRKIHLLR